MAFGVTLRYSYTEGMRLCRCMPWDVCSGGDMLRWAIAFFIVALIAALFGFGGIAVAAAGIAKIIFYLFLILFLISLLAHLLRRSL